MVVFPNCKINIGLYVTGKRADGFHNIETIFYPINWHDALEAVPAQSNHTSLFVTGNDLQGKTAENIVLKAYWLLKQYFPELPLFDFYLHKAIPTGAGLGGGSADGAFALQLIAQMGNLSLGTKDLMQYAASLGSDCPFFITNKPCFGAGRGEVLEPIALSLHGWHIVLVNPGIHVSTANAFKQLSPAPADFDLRNLPQHDIGNWQTLIRNDFEQPVFEQHPAIAAIKDTLYKKGASYAAMSGSGSTVFGLFKDAVTAEDWQLPEEYTLFCTRL